MVPVGMGLRGTAAFDKATARTARRRTVYRQPPVPLDIPNCRDAPAEQVHHCFYFQSVYTARTQCMANDTDGPAGPGLWSARW